METLTDPQMQSTERDIQRKIEWLVQKWGISIEDATQRALKKFGTSQQEPETEPTE